MRKPMFMNLVAKKLGIKRKAIWDIRILAPFPTSVGQLDADVTFLSQDKMEIRTVRFFLQSCKTSIINYKLL